MSEKQKIALTQDIINKKKNNLNQLINQVDLILF